MKKSFFLILGIVQYLLICSQNQISFKNIIKDYNYSIDSFFIGASLNHFQLNSQAENLFLNEFNYLTPANAFKQTIIHPRPNIWKWEKCNDFINFANENNLVLRVHGPISPQSSKWAKDDERTKEELTLILDEYFIELCKKVNKE
ncbi:MAG: endo-1,4-beta-xylanase, partial [Bacteroidota bacterium]|nr:endo-1,4-beta-xylanase [Bacteroidota bacterium]